jgi:hypothetical protein
LRDLGTPTGLVAGIAATFLDVRRSGAQRDSNDHKGLLNDAGRMRDRALAYARNNEVRTDSAMWSATEWEKFLGEYVDNAYQRSHARTRWREFIRGRTIQVVAEAIAAHRGDFRAAVRSLLNQTANEGNDHGIAAAGR